MNKPLLTIVSVLESGRVSLDGLRQAIQDINARLDERIDDIEFVLVGNGIAADDILKMKRLLDEIPDLQFFALTKCVPHETALLAGIEHAIGTLVVTLDLADYDGVLLAEMIDQSVAGSDAVIVCTKRRAAHGLYGLFRKIFYCTAGGINEAAVTSQRLMTKQVVNFILQHDDAAMLLRALPLKSGFSVKVLWSDLSCGMRRQASLMTAVARGIRVITSDSARPLRIVSLLGVVGGLANVIYMGYVVSIALFRGAVEGWTTLSLQISGMFFFVSFMLALLAEYVLQIHSRAVKRPEYFVAQELRSNVITREKRLNVEAPDRAA
jgi:hypothetical protein